MLHEDFNAKRRNDGEDVFTEQLDDEVVRNLNPDFVLRVYQKEALGRFDFYMGGEYQNRQYPTHLLYHMATGSGKTLIMAANILQLYRQGYRNFVFFVNNRNTIEKTRENFLNPRSSKYLFADTIQFDEKEISVREVDNFDEAHADDINIVFTTIQGLHYNLNNPKENAVTYEDFEDRHIVFISDEAHHINALTKVRKTNTRQKQLMEENAEIDYSQLNQTEAEEWRSWEGTVQRILHQNSHNILLEFTATIDLQNEAIKEKYKDKILFQYDLKQFRLDGYSKEVNLLQADLSPLERALQALIVSQYRQKVAEHNNIKCKPVVLLKSNRINDSLAFKQQFDDAIAQLREDTISKFDGRESDTIVQDAFNFFHNNGITYEMLTRELVRDFGPDRCVILDSNNVSESDQVLLNTLEDQSNEVRAVFAVDMLNEGWDVLNLFDIVRLYETRQSGGNRISQTTNKEAQLIGRGARYYPFPYEGMAPDQRKFDHALDHQLRPLEELHYHSSQDHRYIAEIRSALQQSGIYPEEEYQEVALNIKESFKHSTLYKKGIVFANKRVSDEREDIKSLQDTQVTTEYSYTIRSGSMHEETLLSDSLQMQKAESGKVVRHRLGDFGAHVIRATMDAFDFYTYKTLSDYFPYLKSRQEFITSDEYLGNVVIELSGPEREVQNPSQKTKYDATVHVLVKMASEVRSNAPQYRGTKEFYPYQMQQVFTDKTMQMQSGDRRASGIQSLDLSKREWFAQTDLYGTSEEEAFIQFLEQEIENLRSKYAEVALLRNERMLAIYDFDYGRRFEPDFVLILKEAKDSTTVSYQIFIEPKGDEYKDAYNSFEHSKEGWKQDFLQRLKNEGYINYEKEDEQFRLLGLPFYNEQLESAFRTSFEDQII